MKTPVLYGYWRSSATWRARIGLNLKQIAFDYRPVHLVRDGGEHRAAAHTARNRLQQVPVLDLGDGKTLTQSFAILAWAEATQPNPALYPADPWQRAKTTELAQIVNSGIQPLQNLSLLQHLDRLGEDKIAWGKAVIAKGLVAMEGVAADLDGPFLVGDQPTIADIALVPQLYNARRFGVDLSAMPRLLGAEAHCVQLDAFQDAHPDQQPDAQKA